MIPFDFDYYRPSTIQEAVSLMKGFMDNKEKASYYAGGTELMTNFRKGKMPVQAVIDIKAIHQVHQMTEGEEAWEIGAGVPLTRVIEETSLTPLNEVLRKIADHTTRNALSLGGNITGRLPYREAVLPLLAMEAQVSVASVEGVRTLALKDIFDKRLLLGAGDLLVSFHIPKAWPKTFAIRHTENTKVDYPIFHLLGADLGDQVLIGLSGYGSFPVYQYFDRTQLTQERIAEDFAAHAKDNQRATADYKRHLLAMALEDMKKEWGGSFAHEG